MAIGPAVAVAMLLLLWHLRRDFFTRVLAPWTGGWVLGFSPVIWYNLTNQAVIAGQVDAKNMGRFGSVLKALVTNAWPRFWGVDFAQVANPSLRALFVALLVWIGVLYAWTLVQGLLKWRRGEDVSGYQLVFGYFILHLAVTTVSSYGSRFETSTPLSYVGPLFAVAFCIPALVLQSRFSRTVKALALLPFGILVANNLVANAVYPKNFFAALGERGLADVTRYPNEENPFLQLSRAARAGGRVSRAGLQGGFRQAPELSAQSRGFRRGHLSRISPASAMSRARWPSMPPGASSGSASTAAGCG